MRNPKRLDDFYIRMKKIHANFFPDWRFGQLMSNFFGWLIAEKRVDCFFPEEDKMIHYLEEYAKENSQWR